MYAVIKTGGKQYKVQPGDIVRVEKIDKELGAELDLTEVLMIGGDSPVVGTPLVKNAKVTAVITQQAKDKKVIIFKKRRRQGYRRMKGHRQFFTELFIKSITSPEGNVIKAEKEAVVVDVVKRREERLAAKQAEKQASREEVLKTVEASGATQKAAPKKATPKKKKKTTKKSGSKKAGATKSKRSVKKAGAKAKKTTKKASKK